MKNKRSFKGLYWLLSIFIIAVGGFFILNHFYEKVYKPSVTMDQEKAFLHIPSGADFQTIKDSLYQKGWVQDTANFGFVARWMNLPGHVYPGRYKISDGMSNKSLVELLRSGQNVPVNLTLKPYSDISAIAGYVSNKLEADSAKIVNMLNQEAILNKWGFDQNTRLCLFIPNTYEFYWHTSAKEFLERMYKEYNNFWDQEKRQKAERLGLTLQEVQILASIVQKESAKQAEWDTIAGVYLNRLEDGIRLQADVTLKYILEKRGKDVKRIYNKHKKLESPFNTYNSRGLPPGPLVSPEIAAIKAVLNPVDHEYYYFVAKPGFSGYHTFSESPQEHQRNAAKYQRFLDQQNIH